MWNGTGGGGGGGGTRLSHCDRTVPEMYQLAWVKPVQLDIVLSCIRPARLLGLCLWFAARAIENVVEAAV